MARSCKNQIVAVIGCVLVLSMLFPVVLAWSQLSTESMQVTAFALQEEPVPTADPLDIPELPENPTQIDIGRVSYYYNCMPCHGDHGQGLTDEWRETWVEDHQNCWARGCHGGRAGEEGFPLATTIPAVAGAPEVLDHFPSPESLYEYLTLTHPPQRPGALADDEYWALTMFLLAENGRPIPEKEPGLRVELPTFLSSMPVLIGFTLGILSVLAVLLRHRQSRKGRGPY